jgi:CheY-like chemotaxis protein
LHQGTLVPDSPILLVEDHQDTRVMLTQFFGHHGYQVTTAADGQHAWSLIEAGLRPCLLIVDLLMPRVSGGDLLTLLANDPDLRTIPVFVVTGQSLDRTRVVADRIFRKPVDPAQLLDALQQLAAAGKTDCAVAALD